MTDKEYKALMLYELLMCSHDLSDCNYAAVDRNGSLHAYKKRPKTNSIFDVWDNIEATFWTHIIYMTPPKKWEDTLVEL